MDDLILEFPSTAERAVRRRERRDPEPHFLPDVSGQLDAVHGCPQVAVAQDHLARRVLEMTERFDLRAVEERYSSLGRNGHHPRRVLAVWIYASMMGVHHSTKVAVATETDVAYRLLSGGHTISESVLRKFRQHNQALFQQCIESTVAWAIADGLLPHDELAVDGMRLRANASLKAVRTVSRSTERLKELAAVDTAQLSPETKEKHDAKLTKHREALAACAARGTSNVVLTNPSATLLKFPTGASAPGHRITATVAGVSERIIVHVLVDASPSDFGKLPDAVIAARNVLRRSGLPDDARLQVAADPGYYSHDDLAFAAAERESVDVLIPHKAQANTSTSPRGVFGREHFRIQPDGTALCPADRLMKGPWRQATGQVKYQGVGCSTCSLRSQCTKSTKSPRAFYLHPDLDRLHDEMRGRMAEPGAQARYGQRIATVEPAFAGLQEQMRFRQSSTQHADAIVAEVLLKVLAYNMGRLLARRRLLLASFAWEF